MQWGRVCAAASILVTGVLWHLYRSRRHKPKPIVIVGDTFMDIMAGPIQSLPAWGEDRTAINPIQLTPGGSALNTTVQLNHLLRLFSFPSLCPPILYSAVGDDAFASMIHSTLQQQQVRNKFVVKPEHSTGACIVLTGKSDRGFVSHSGAVAAVHVEDMDVTSILEGCHLHVGGFYNMEGMQAGVGWLLKQAKGKGMTTSMNTQYDAREKWDGLEDVLESVDVLLVSEIEVTKLSGKCDAAEGGKELCRRGVGVVVVTLGERGALAVIGGESVVEQRAVKMEVVDTTGAGDGFNAGFLAGWKSSGGCVVEGLRWGCGVGSAVVGVFGASSLPSKDSLLYTTNNRTS